MKKLLGLNERIASVDTPISSESGKPLIDTLADSNNTDPAELLSDENLSEHIDKWLDELNPNQREVIARRFGLRGYERATLEEVGKEIGLTRERVRQIQVEALKALRHLLEEKGLSEDSVFE